MEKFYDGMPIRDALVCSLERLQVGKKTRNDMRNYLRRFTSAMTALQLDQTPVEKFGRRQIKLTLDRITQTRGEIPPRTYNLYRAYLMMLWNELVELDFAETNPLRDIKKRKEIKKLRNTMTAEDRKRVLQHLLEKHPDFARFIQIFFHSGARVAELFRMKVRDVDLVRQEFKLLVLKGRSPSEQMRPIKTIALPIWEVQLQGAAQEDFVFSLGFKAGSFQLHQDRATRVWAQLIKDQLGIKADLYSLKHSNLDEVSALQGLDMAQKLAGHTSSTTTRVYTVNEKKREIDRLKGLDNEF